jgi:hypothetical protein
MATVASRDHPLVIFLDDLQWADPSTLSILSSLLQPSSAASSSTASILSASVSHLLILGAYRENEVSRDHAFVRLVEDLRARGSCVQVCCPLPFLTLFRCFLPSPAPPPPLSFPLLLATLFYDTSKLNNFSISKKIV